MDENYSDSNVDINIKFETSGSCDEENDVLVQEIILERSLEDDDRSDTEEEEEDEEYEENCQHQEVDELGMCKDCGERISLGTIEGSTSFTSSSHHDDSFLSISQLHLPLDVEKTGHRIMYKLSQIRIKRKKLSVFYSVYQACLENDSPVSPELLARRLNLTKKEVTKSFSIFAESKTGYRPSDRQLLPEDYASEYGKVLGISEKLISQYKYTCQKLINEYPDLLMEGPPQKICAGVYLWYLRNGFYPMSVEKLGRFDEKCMSDLFGLSSTTVRNIAKTIGDILKTF